MDALLEVLRKMRLTGGIFLEAEFTAPWCVAARVGPEDCAPFTAPPRQIIAYHYVTDGRCFLTVAGQPPVILEAGEIVVLPRNDAHVIGSGPKLRAVAAEHLIQPAPDGGGLAKITYGGGGERTRILCGFLGNDMPDNGLVALLPSVLKLAVAEGVAGTWIESSFGFAAKAMAEERDDAAPILAKLAELLFMEAVRRYLASHPAGAGMGRGMPDPIVGRALGLLHGQIARHWTTEALAREVGQSRSTFAERFTRVMGEPPIRYLARQRLEQAAARLRDTADPISRIAFEVGYESEAAFSRAFRRACGAPPASWRRMGRAGEAPSAGRNESPEEP